ncbi:50S ribosomal protein L25/general stress protein Ctc [Pararhodospirillum oryzae]|uniref:Large ribosomal subunit protein bL25 n=1 Tax=Pararhodospirillum oryzae TaxID=478448 RepID=A0A512HAC9_9PROT|nr:50S ribosomal protein L25/general stress protein Ctc [Pararhodospirillum oryzae]GEO82407.1 50S ribosomal protein L25 [Pararhodospirillum oryzae]
MTELETLAVEGRDRAGKGAARATRRQGLIPGVIYGGRQSPALVAIDPRVVLSEMKRPGFSTRMFAITVAGEAAGRVMIHDVQLHPVSDMPIHVDFLRIDADSAVTVSVPVHFINEDRAPGLKRGGVLNVVRHEVEVVGRPDSLPPFLEVDLTGLEISDSVHISAVAVPEGVRPTITDRDFTLCSIAAPSVMKTTAEDETPEATS